MQGVVEVESEEPVILEPPEDAEQHDHGADHRRPALPSLVEPGDEERPGLSDDRHTAQQEDEVPVPPAIEEDRAHRQPQGSDSMTQAGDQKKAAEDDRQKAKEEFVGCE